MGMRNKFGNQPSMEKKAAQGPVEPPGQRAKAPQEADELPPKPNRIFGPEAFERRAPGQAQATNQTPGSEPFQLPGWVKKTPDGQVDRTGVWCIWLE